jgi:hypothetical protein
VSNEFLKRSLSDLYAFSGKHDHHALQRWRSFSVEAIFKMNHDVETAFNYQLTTSIANLELFIQKITAETSGDFFLIGYTEHHQLIQIVKTARDLSFKIQHGIVSC